MQNPTKIPTPRHGDAISLFTVNVSSSCISQHYAYISLRHYSDLAKCTLATPMSDGEGKILIDIYGWSGGNFWEGRVAVNWKE